MKNTIEIAILKTPKQILIHFFFAPPPLNDSNFGYKDSMKLEYNNFETRDLGIMFFWIYLVITTEVHHVMR